MVSKTRVIALSCVKITAVHCLVLSQIIIIIIIHTFLSRHKVVTSEAVKEQSTRVTDKQTDGCSERITTANTALAKLPAR